MNKPPTDPPEEAIKIPDVLPVLPLKDTVVFPYIILPLSVGRDKSVLAVDRALAESRVIMLVAQRDSTIDNPGEGDLYDMGDPVLSVSVVPVGLTEFSKHSRVREPTAPECRIAVQQVERWEARARAERGAPWVHGADELYLRAELPLPAEDTYGDFQQMENGVGSVRFLQRQVRAGASRFRVWAGKRIGIVTGTSMGRLMPQVVEPLETASRARLELIVVENGLFGPRVTTAGLLPGRSIAQALSGRSDLDLVLLPGESVNDDLLFIDSMAAEALQAEVPMPLRFSKDFTDALDGAAA